MNNSNNSFYFGLIGCFALIGGVFVPLISAPIMGSINYFQGGSGDGVLILILAGISLLLILTKKYKGLYLTGLLSSGLIIYTFTQIRGNLTQSGEDFGIFGDLAADMVQYQWGWALLIIGVITIFISAKMA